MMAQWVKLSSVIHEWLYFTSQLLHSQSSFLLMHLGKRLKMVQVVGPPCHPCGRPGLELWALDLTLPPSWVLQPLGISTTGCKILIHSFSFNQSFLKRKEGKIQTVAMTSYRLQLCISSAVLQRQPSCYPASTPGGLGAAAVQAGRKLSHGGLLQLLEHQTQQLHFGLLYLLGLFGRLLLPSFLVPLFLFH